MQWMPMIVIQSYLKLNQEVGVNKWLVYDNKMDSFF